MSQSFDKTDNSQDEKISVHDMTAAHFVDKPEGYFPVTPEEKSMNRKVNRKFDMWILPFLSLMYLFSGLDRGMKLYR